MVSFTFKAAKLKAQIDFGNHLSLHFVANVIVLFLTDIPILLFAVH